MASADWFECLTGFRETDYDTTQSRLRVDGNELVSTVNGARYGCGELSLPTLAELRSATRIPAAQRSTVSSVIGDAGELHAEPEFAGALFQVASQFNVLEMVGPGVRPENGVSRYADDHTQGPACAIAAGAATIYRNYLVPMDGGIGQRAGRQLDALAHLGRALSVELRLPVDALWAMRNGYALGTEDGLDAITNLLAGASEQERDRLRGQLAIGLHRNVEVTNMGQRPGQSVSQAFCSALPISYSPVPKRSWKAFACLVLEASYEATLLAATAQAASGGSNTVLLTRVGGGAFGNDDDWIDRAIGRALKVVEHAGLDIRLVGYGRIHPSTRAIIDDWSE